nr:Na+/H+ antiporter [Microlunatus panaciterrae]
MLAACVIAVTAAAERVGLSAPLLLMVVGIGLSFVPFIPDIHLSSGVVLFGMLPPLLYAAAIRTSVIDFRANQRAIGFLSIALVAITALGVGLVVWLILPVPFAVAFAIGAVVAPPDAVAATSIARRVGLPRRLVTILEGESLVNDATAITCLRVAILAMAGSVTVGNITLAFVIAAGGGALVGLAVAWIAGMVRKRITEPLFDNAISLLLPFCAYLPAEAIRFGHFHPSGVIAVVVTGLLLGHKAPIIQTAQSRLSERTNWGTIKFLLENSVFFLIGLQAHWIFAGVAHSPLHAGVITWLCVAVLLAVILLRLVWVAAASLLLFRNGRRLSPDWPSVLIIGWAGMRGVVTLAAAFLLPEQTPHREVLLLVAMVVTAGTLLLQGLTLPWLSRRFGLRGPEPREDALQTAAVLQASTRAALRTLDRIRKPTDSEQTLELLRSRMRDRPNAIWERLGSASDLETPAEEYRRLRLETLEAERAEVLRIRYRGKVDHEVIDLVLSQLDIEESMLDAVADRAEQLRQEPLVSPIATDECEHLAAAPTVIRPIGPGVCLDCEREGTRPVHLRLCLTCGNIGCCDSSVGNHATKHFAATGHPVMRSFESGERWRWCYLHEQLG